jgi:hypothetical protein
MAGYEWLDDEAGPVVRPYAVTQGRTRSTSEMFELITIVVTAPVSLFNPTIAPRTLLGAGPEHQAILELCTTPQSVAEISAWLKLPLGVVRVLLGDLLDLDLVVVRQPEPADQAPTQRLLKEVLNGLEAL